MRSGWSWKKPSKKPSIRRRELPANRVIGSFSKPCSTFSARAARGATCPPNWAFGTRFTCASDAGKRAGSGRGRGKISRPNLSPERPKKSGPDQALGRSRGGWSTKLHAATLDENCAVALHLTAGQAHEGRQFEALYESLDPDNVLEFAALDRGYDADRIRARLALDGIAPVIPPLSTRCSPPPYDRELYRGRNRVERFFNKLKPFRRLATRYDKLAKTFFAAVCLVAAFLITKNS